MAAIMAYFNSIKVRLELFFGVVKFRSIVFQFHKGTIRTFSQRKRPLPASTFQFHKGTIRTLLPAACKS